MKNKLIFLSVALLIALFNYSKSAKISSISLFLEPKVSKEGLSFWQIPEEAIWGVSGLCIDVPIYLHTPLIYKPQIVRERINIVSSTSQGSINP